MLQCDIGEECEVSRLKSAITSRAGGYEKGLWKGRGSAAGRWLVKAELAPEFCPQLSPIEVRDQVAAIDLGDYC